MNWVRWVEENKDDPSMVHAILNILLVLKKVRPAMLIEGMNFSKKTRKEKLLKLLQVARDSGLKFILENQEHWRYLVASPRVIDVYTEKPTEKNLGKVLGFYCYKHKYNDQTRKRLSAEIKIGLYKSDVQIMVEVCELKKISKDLKHFHEYYEILLRKISEVLVPLGFPNPTLAFTEISSVTLRIEALDRYDLEYIEKNMGEYINDLDNYWAPDSILAQKFPKMILDKKNHSLLKAIWRVFVKGDLSSGLPFPGEKINLEMGRFDRDLFGKDSIPTEVEIIKRWNDMFGKFVRLEM